MKVPDRCGNGHALTKANLRFGKAKRRDGTYRKRWFCKTCRRNISRRRSERVGRVTPELRRGMHESVDPGPFLKWFESFCRRYDFTRTEACQAIGIDDTQIRRCYNPSPGPPKYESGRISVATVDKALLYMDTNIRDLYPALFDE